MIKFSKIFTVISIVILVITLIVGFLLIYWNACADKLDDAVVEYINDNYTTLTVLDYKQISYNNIDGDWDEMVYRVKVADENSIFIIEVTVNYLSNGLIDLHNWPFEYDKIGYVLNISDNY